MTSIGRRIHDRLSYCSEVKIFLDEGSVPGACQNISQGGMFIETSLPIGLGETVLVEFSLPAIDTPIRADSRVVWTERDGDLNKGIGIQFTSLRPLEVWAINQLRRAQEP